MEKRLSDMNLLLPSFRARAVLVLERLVQRGFDPKVFETRRTFERAAMLGKTGPGIPLSMHCYDAAVDIISASRTWHWPEFFEALRDEGEAVGLTAGFRFPKVDADHLQAIPVRLQNTFRALPLRDRDGFVKRFLDAYDLRQAVKAPRQ